MDNQNIDEQIKDKRGSISNNLKGILLIMWRKTDENQYKKQKANLQVHEQ